MSLFYTDADSPSLEMRLTAVLTQSPDCQRKFFATLHEPVQKLKADKAGNTYLLSGAELVSNVLSDSSRFSAYPSSVFPPVPGRKLSRQVLSLMRAEEHLEFKTCFKNLLTASELRKSAFINDVINLGVAELKCKSEIQFVGTILSRLGLIAVAHVIGFPTQDILEYTKAMQKELFLQEHAGSENSDVFNYLIYLLQSRNTQSNDFMRRLFSLQKARINLSEEEMFYNLLLLFEAASHTISYSVARTLLGDKSIQAGFNANPINIIYRQVESPVILGHHQLNRQDLLTIPTSLCSEARICGIKMSFGSGAYLCPGANITQTLIQMCQKVFDSEISSVNIVEAALQDNLVMSIPKHLTLSVT